MRRSQLSKFGDHEEGASTAVVVDRQAPPLRKLVATTYPLEKGKRQTQHDLMQHTNHSDITSILQNRKPKLQQNASFGTTNLSNETQLHSIDVLHDK